MTRRDIIIISVLVNAGLLAILFVTAVRTDPEQVQLEVEEKPNFVQREEIVPEPEIIPLEFTSSSPQDEVDDVLRSILPEAAISAADSSPPDDPGPGSPTPEPDEFSLVDVTVKKGDSLDKIARANGTSIDAIRKASKLSNDKLKIGQVLKVPVGTKIAKGPDVPKPQTTENVSTDPVYYTVKSGDNPWKIAKQFHVKYEDILRLNHLDEEKARNMKIGDKIRVK